jgi:hypothetical protein
MVFVRGVIVFVKVGACAPVTIDVGVGVSPGRARLSKHPTFPLSMSCVVEMVFVVKVGVYTPVIIDVSLYAQGARLGYSVLEEQVAAFFQYLLASLKSNAESRVEEVPLAALICCVEWMTARNLNGPGL